MSAGTTRGAEAAAAEEGRLRARPGKPSAPGASPGEHPLGLARGRDGILRVPRGYTPDRPTALAVMFHGAGGDAEHGIALLRAQADEAGLLLLAPDSRKPTWDAIFGDYGPDVRFLDEALELVFAHYAVDPARIAVGGFSDGASYALSLGLGNGDLFRHIIAFSPGFAAPPPAVGKPRIFMCHGTHDAVLPISRCSRRLAPALEHAHYDVDYREFDGPHVVPEEMRRAAVEWLARASPH